MKTWVLTILVVATMVSGTTVLSAQQPATPTDQHQVLKKEVGTWCDTSTPYLSTMEGDWDEPSKTWTYMMTGRDAAGNETGGKLVTRMLDEYHKSFTMYMSVPGNESSFTKLMDVEYTRRK